MAWFDTIEEGARAGLTAHGWQAMEGDAAAVAIYKSYTELEKKAGVPADRLVRWPDKPDDAEAWAPIYQKLGVPGDPKGYDLSQIKYGDGTPFDPEDVAFYQGLAHDLKLPAATAATLVQRLVKASEEAVAAQEAGAKTAQTDILNETHNKLKLNWGANYEAFKVAAERMAQAAGDSPEEIAAFTPEKWEARRVLAMRMGEAPMLGLGGQQGGGTPQQMTREEARRAFDEKLTDPDWTAKYNAGDKAAVADFVRLTTAMAGQRQ
jgi:hypothetical protein